MSTPTNAGEAATTYWANAHAEKVKKLPNLIEYNQLLFSTTDHGFWPATPSVGTTIPETWRVDGCGDSISQLGGNVDDGTPCA
jgi:hypothetical protein